MRIITLPNLGQVDYEPTEMELFADYVAGQWGVDMCEFEPTNVMGVTLIQRYATDGDDKPDLERIHLDDTMQIVYARHTGFKLHQQLSLENASEEDTLRALLDIKNPFSEALKLKKCHEVFSVYNQRNESGKTQYMMAVLNAKLAECMDTNMFTSTSDGYSESGLFLYETTRDLSLVKTVISRYFNFYLAEDCIQP